MLTNRPRTKILVDGGDPNETLRIKNLMGFVDGQTTNPSLIAKNPEIQRLNASGHKLSSQEEKEEYKKIVQSISPLVGDAGVSIEVFADLDTRAEEMLAQGEEMFSWIPNAYVKYPCKKVFGSTLRCVFLRNKRLPCMPRRRGQRHQFMYRHLSAGLTIAAKTAWILSET